MDAYTEVFAEFKLSKSDKVMLSKEVIKDMVKTALTHELAKQILEQNLYHMTLTTNIDRLETTYRVIVKILKEEYK